MPCQKEIGIFKILWVKNLFPQKKMCGHGAGGFLVSQGYHGLVNHASQHHRTSGLALPVANEDLKPHFGSGEKAWALFGLLGVLYQGFHTQVFR